MNQYKARFLAWLLALSLLLSLAACGGKDKATAANMRLTRAEGTVSVSDSGGTDIPVLDNLGLYSGYSVDTRSESYAWISLDDTKLTKLDQDSGIAIRQAGKALEIEVKSGSLFFHVARPLADGETLDIRSSTMMIGVRGTCGWVENRDGRPRVYLLKGEVECSTEGQTVRVSAGETAEVVPDGNLTVAPFTAQEIPAFVREELEKDSALAQDILESSGIDVLAPSEPDSITGVVTDLVTGRPLEGVTVICENGEASARSETGKNGVYHISGLPAGEYQIHAVRDDCEEGPYIGVTLDGAAAELDLTLRPFYAQAYMDFLLENQVGVAGLITYGRGQGRFALVQMTDDNVPELLLIGEFDAARLLTYLDGEIRSVDLDEGSTDVPYVYWKRLRIISGEVFAEEFDDMRGIGWRLYEREPDQVFSYVLSASIFTKDGACYVNEYDESVMLDWQTAYEYLMNYENREVSRAEYERALAAYGVNEETNLRLTENDIHYITPAELEAIFAGQ